MGVTGTIKAGLILTVLFALTACGDREGRKGLFGKRDKAGRAGEQSEPRRASASAEEEERETIWDLFDRRDDPNVTIEVNRYIWNASLDVLSFLPVEATDPFSGLIITGYGTPPGGGRDYRATVHVRDPALDARSLSLSLQTRSGPVARETVIAVEDAILTRARYLRQQDGRL